MGFTLLIQTLAQDPAVSIKSALRIVHFIGLALGLGAATVLDLLVLRFLIRGKITQDHWNVFKFGSKVVNWGLILLWATGLGFLTYYGVFDPVKLGNEKVWAKMIIVLILTVNGGFIHSIILPRVKKQIGRSIMEGLPSSHRSVFIVTGAISAVSWYVPMMLGALPQLNFAVPMGTILLAYAALLGSAILAAHALLFVMTAGHIEEASEDVALSAEFA
ncbi:hypothetical protein K9B32_03810 [Rhizobium sp. 3T7]|uniref:hypothetical protein n=1 Tax=Rhizobium sp. 3T7 TaxID=2874922 RepID=UPI001CCAD1D7|nr:hypothetical protein [Rhizobium sp. 3T7]MBZ9789255.1 hypothetical protein [Rhizobium sp. 3T7]